MDEKDMVILKLRRERTEILMALLQMQFQQAKRELEQEILPALRKIEGPALKLLAEQEAQNGKHDVVNQSSGGLSAGKE